MQRQGALADATLAGADGDEVSDAGEPLGDASLLFGNLFEDSGASVAGDVVVALHVERIAYTVPGKTGPQRIMPLAARRGDSTSPLFSPAPAIRRLKRRLTG